MGLALQSTDRTLHLPAQLVQVLAAAVLQFDPLQQIPDSLVGVELRRVAGQLFQVESPGRPSGEEVLHRLAPVNRRAVPDDQELPAHSAQELPEKGYDRRTPHCRLLDMGEQPARRGDGTDSREVVVRQRRTQDRRLATWRVRAGREGQQIEAGLVYEEDGTVLLARFA